MTPKASDLAARLAATAAGVRLFPFMRFNLHIYSGRSTHTFGGSLDGEPRRGLSQDFSHNLADSSHPESSAPTTALRPRTARALTLPLTTSCGRTRKTRTKHHFG